MHLAPMRMSDAEKKDKAMPDSVIDDRPKYPYCLRLHLESDVVDKLGLKEMPDVEDIMSLVAKVKVMGVRIEENNGIPKHSLELQITDMSLSNGEGEVKKEENDFYKG